jgi:type II secretory pathway pseudopilin PulG
MVQVIYVVGLVALLGSIVFLGAALQVDRRREEQAEENLREFPVYLSADRGKSIKFTPKRKDKVVGVILTREGRGSVNDQPISVEEFEAGKRKLVSVGRVSQ